MRLGTKTILVLSGVIALSTALNFLVVREIVYPSVAVGRVAKLVEIG